MNVARSKERAELEEQRRRLQQERLELEHTRSAIYGASDSDNRINGIASAGGLLKLLLG